MSRTMSAIFATSIMLANESEGHSRNVKRRRFDVTTVKGPSGVLSVCFEYLLTKDLISVVFPTCQQPAVSYSLLEMAI